MEMLILPSVVEMIPPEAIANVLDMFMNTGVFAILFAWLFFDTRKEAKEREMRLMENIDKQNIAMGRITETIEKMDTRLNHIENRIQDK